jgi:hypothetical protein
MRSSSFAAVGGPFEKRVGRIRFTGDHERRLEALAGIRAQVGW